MTDERQEPTEAQTPTDGIASPEPRLPWEVSGRGEPPVPPPPIIAAIGDIASAEEPAPRVREEGTRMAQIAEGGRIAIMAKISDAKDRLSRLSQERDVLNTQCQGLETELGEERALTACLQEETRDLNAHVDTLEKERDDNLATIGRLTTELDEATRRNADMAQRCDSMGTTIDEITAALDAIDSLG